VNGDKISSIKRCVYLTPTGIPTLIGRLSNFSLTDTQIESLKSDAKKIAKSKYSGPGQKKDKFPTPFDGLNWDYKTHLFVMMLLFGENEQYLDRFQNIIKMESEAKKGSYNISNSYTYIKVNIKGEFKPFLPVSNISSSGMFKMNREEMRGY
jgi:hypothetical protein